MEAVTPNCHCEAEGRGNPGAWANGRRGDGGRSGERPRVAVVEIAALRSLRQRGVVRHALSGRAGHAGRRSRQLNPVAKRKKNSAGGSRNLPNTLMPNA